MLPIDTLTDRSPIYEFEKVYEISIPDGLEVLIKFENNVLDLIGDTDATATLPGLLYDYLKAFDMKEILIYGLVLPNWQFKAYDVKLNGDWLDVNTARMLADYCKLGFVDVKIVDPAIINLQDNDNKVYRPMKECIDVYGLRIIAKVFNKEIKPVYLESKVSDITKEVQESINKIVANVDYRYSKPEEK